MKILNFIFLYYQSVSVIIYSHIWNKIRKSVWQDIRDFFKKIASLYFWNGQPISFDNVIFSQWGQLSADSIKDFFLKIRYYTIVYYMIFICGSLTKLFRILEDLFWKFSGITYLDF